VIAFVFPGGASLGAVQVGMLKALQEAGVRPDFCVGSSVGALNAAWVAADPTRPVAELEEIWLGIRRVDVFPVSPMQMGLAVLGRRQYLVPNEGLRQLVSRVLPLRRLDAGRVPLAVVTTDVNSGQPVVHTTGAAIPALLASCAIPGIFPPVKIGGRYLMDGGIANNAAIDVAVRADADRVYVLPSGYACALERAPATALGMTLHALSFVVHQRLIADVEHFVDRVDLRVAPPLCPLAVSPADFSHTPELIARGYQQTRAWLRAGERSRGAEHLAFHGRHRARPAR
jgi:NTE family protein